tara:strand:- start:366 stop:2357 length:1992 start_codon:yes stop_codon:yes gene_type:complete
MLSQKLALAAAGAADAPIYVDDVFSTFLYDGTGSALTITNGIDLSGEGGLVWTKRRNIIRSHILFDSERSASLSLKADFDYGAVSQPYSITMNSDGYSWSGADNDVNVSGSEYCSWTFRKCPGFFDIVTYTGNGTAGRTIAHSLGSVPGCIIVKKTSNDGDWAVFHRANKGFFASDPANDLHLHLNQNHTAQGSSSYWNDTDPTSSVFTVGNNNDVNQSGETYVAYLFAHDDQLFGDDGDEAIIKCGSFTASTGSPHTVNVGFEPQWVIIKRTATNIGDWTILDNMRGWVADTSSDGTVRLLANLSNTEEGVADMSGLTSTGFTVDDGGITYGSNQNYIYIAIRRSHKPPEAATDVFAIDTNDGGYSANVPSFVSNFPVDLLIRRNQINNADDPEFVTRITREIQNLTLMNNRSDGGNTIFGYNNGVYNINYVRATDYAWMFKRAAKFLDIVTYTGNGAQGRNIAHNLGAAPDLMIVKNRESANDFHTYVRGITYLSVYGSDPSSYGNNPARLYLNEDSDATFSASGSWDHTHPTATHFRVGNAGGTNDNSAALVAYLFASLDGISKVGTYTGTGSTQNIDCGFTNGARFVLIKRCDAADNWHLFDTTQGINSGAEPYYRLDLSAAQVTGNDWIDPLSSGFKLVSSDPGTNASGGSYIFFAIA